MPWYFLAYTGGAVHGYGVQTQAAAMCFWQLDGYGVSLWLDVSNGGSGVQLGDRDLLAATVTTRQGSTEEKPMEAATAFCALFANVRGWPNLLYTAAMIGITPTARTAPNRPCAMPP